MAAPPKMSRRVINKTEVKTHLTDRMTSKRNKSPLKQDEDGEDDYFSLLVKLREDEDEDDMKTVKEKKENPLTIDNRLNSIYAMSKGVERRLEIVLDHLHYSGDSNDTKKDVEEPQGVLGILGYIEDRLTEAVRLLHNIESVIGIETPTKG